MLAVAADLVETPHLDGLLRDASPATRAGLTAAARPRAIAVGDTVAIQGGTVDLVLVTYGVLAVRRSNVDGRRLTLFLVTAGQVAGLPAAAHRLRSPVDLVALTGGRIEVLPGALVRSYAERDPGLSTRLLDLTIEYAGRLVQRIDEATFEHARRRLAATILEYEPLIAGRRSVVSRGDLAGLIGASREMLGCALRALESDGIVMRVGRRIEIRDYDALEREGERAASGDDAAELIRRSTSAPRPTGLTSSLPSTGGHQTAARTESRAAI